MQIESGFSTKQKNNFIKKYIFIQKYGCIYLMKKKLFSSKIYLETPVKIFFQSFFHQPTPWLDIWNFFNVTPWKNLGKNFIKPWVGEKQREKTEKCPKFPNRSTPDQFFFELRFEFDENDFKELKEEPISPKKDNILINNSIKQNSVSPVTGITSKPDKKNDCQENCEAVEAPPALTTLIPILVNQPPKAPTHTESSSLNKLLMVSSSKDPMMSSSISTPSTSKLPVRSNSDSSTDLNIINSVQSAQQPNNVVNSFTKWKDF